TSARWRRRTAARRPCPAGPRPPGPGRPPVRSRLAAGGRPGHHGPSQPRPEPDPCHSRPTASSTGPSLWVKATADNPGHRRVRPAVLINWGGAGSPGGVAGRGGGKTVAVESDRAAERARQRALVRRGYDVISLAYRGDDGEVAASSAEDVSR